MSELIRFGVSLPSDLLEKFDSLSEKKGGWNRSEAIRDLIRAELVRNQCEDPDEEVAGVLSLVYDHHVSGLAQKLTEMQHGDHDTIIAALHVHLDHHNCLEVLLLKGQAGNIRALADRLISVKGVKHGNLHLTSTGKDLP